VKVALLTTDNREHHRRYDRSVPYFGTAPEALLQGFAMIPELEVHVISCTQQPMNSPGKLANNIWFHSLFVPKIGWLRTGYQGCIRAVRRKLRYLHPDIVHGQGTERDCAISAVFSGFASVVTIHGNMAELARRFSAPVGSYGWLAAQFESFALRRANGVFCNSKYTKALVGSRAKRTWRVANAIRQEFFVAGSDALMPGRPPVLLCVGDIIPRKRQLEFLDLAESLWRDGCKFEIHFIGRIPGDTPYACAFSKRIASLKDSVRHLGELSTPELIRRFDAANALVHVPSEEAFGLVVAEALTRNLKLFATNVGGIADIAGDIEGAELFSLGDDTAMCSAISRWLAQECPRPHSPATEMRSRYHPQIIARRHLEIYREVTSNIA
jgi:glycosyltransferase involved in cell wall biosynthesis